MATIFDSRWLTAARAVFLAEFGTAIVYQPGILDRSVMAIIKYIQDDANVPPIARHRSPEIQIRVANDPTVGIAASEFVSIQKVNVPPRPGAPPLVMHLARIVKATGVWVTYDCQ